RAAVRGGGIKPWRQKGTGRARHGSSRSPIWVGGGTVFGPHPRDYAYRLPRSARRAALRAALSLRAKEDALLILEGFELEQAKTKEVAAFLDKLGAKSALLVDVGNDKLKRAARNLPHSKYVEAKGLNVYDILDHDKLVLTQAALGEVVKRSELTSAKEQD
ncbi:MAG: 50S ribosomal protein L4, partial [Deltaproteobacteria bacterium]|nr:50S ribosomal protein L4 [Deltaproteobacteria bacterium]